jgi:hypothetical protein
MQGLKLFPDNLYQSNQGSKKVACTIHLHGPGLPLLY